MSLLRVVVLLSGTGTLCQALIDGLSQPGARYELVAVGSDVPDAPGLARAQEADIPTFCVPMTVLAKRSSSERLIWDRKLRDAVAAWEPDLIVSAGFMKLFDAPFMEAFAGRIINTHPALLPAFPGAHAVRDALAAGVTETGSSIFWVNDGVDTGELIAQEPVPVLPGDTEETLHERIKVVERRLLVDTVNALAERKPPVSDRLPLKRALISVYDKTGIEEIGRLLADAGVEIVSTGSTAKTLAAAGLDVIAVESITHFPECFDDRVKTLHPLIHGGLLADRRKETHVAQMQELGVVGIDLLISNLYPFTETVASGAGVEDCIAKIDIGGPAMVRAAAKNHASVAVITSPAQYDVLRDALVNGGTTMAQRQRLAAEAYVHTATYDVAVASWMSSQVADTSEGDGFPAWAGATWDKKAVLRYGENSHQSAALYTNGDGAGGLALAQQFGGKEMSYNNYVDTDAARRAAYDHEEPCVAVVKHNNPCGIAIGADIAEAHRKAHECDPVSAYGGVIACNRLVTLAMAQQVKPIFTEVIVAPDFEPEALELLQTKKNLRILKADAPAREGVEMRHIDGGMLMQHRDVFQGDGDSCENWTLVAGDAADEATLRDLQFAWRSVRAVKSNAILLAKDGASVGVGMGQVNRVDSARLAVQRAGERSMGSVCASDAFFPFADGLEIVLDGGAKAVVQPGGSIRDEEVIALAKERGVTMYFTGNRHFAH